MALYRLASPTPFSAVRNELRLPISEIVFHRSSNRWNPDRVHRSALTHRAGSMRTASYYAAGQWDVYMPLEWLLDGTAGDLVLMVCWQLLHWSVLVVDWQSSHSLNQQTGSWSWFAFHLGLLLSRRSSSLAARLKEDCVSKPTRCKDSLELVLFWFCSCCLEMELQNWTQLVSLRVLVRVFETLAMQFGCCYLPAHFSSRSGSCQCVNYSLIITIPYVASISLSNTMLACSEPLSPCRLTNLFILPAQLFSVISENSFCSSVNRSIEKRNQPTLLCRRLSEAYLLKRCTFVYCNSSNRKYNPWEGDSVALLRVWLCDN